MPSLSPVEVKVFLLVSHACLRESDKKFQCFHMSSLSTIEVKVKKSTREVCPKAQHGDVPSTCVP